MSQAASFRVRTAESWVSVLRELHHIWVDGIQGDDVEVMREGDGNYYCCLSYFTGDDGSVRYAEEKTALLRVIHYLLSISRDDCIVYYRDPGAALPDLAEQATKDVCDSIDHYWPDMTEVNHRYIMRSSNFETLAR